MLSVTGLSFNFNSRSCEGATGEVLEVLALGEISTHAPVKERRR